MPSGSIYTYVANANLSDGTNQIVTSQGTVPLGGYGYFLPDEVVIAESRGLILEAGIVGPAQPGSTGPRLVSTIKSSNGQVPVADGNGGYAWESAGSGTITVTDGTHTETGVTEVNYTSGATVSSGGSGIADVAISGASLEVTDGTHTETGVTEISVSGATVSSGGSGIADITVPTSLPPNGSAGGSLTGTYPNPTVATIPSGATGTTQAANDNSTKIATTAYADTSASNAETAAKNASLPLAGGTMSGAIAMGSNKITGLANGTASTDAAAFGQIPTAGSSTPNMDGTGSAGSATTWSKSDHVHPTDTSRAPVASPTFTGTPAAPTAAADTSTTQLATTAFVIGQASSTTPVVDGTGTVGTSKRYARADHVHPTDTSRAPLASPTFTGIVTAPEFTASGLTGATAASRYVGATTSGAPTTGTFAVGDFIIDQTGYVWVCTTAGTPGTWTKVGGGGSATLPADPNGFLASTLDVGNMPSSGSSVTLLASAGYVLLNKAVVNTAGTTNYINATIQTAGATLTAGECYAGLYDSSGNLLATTGDQSTAWASTGQLAMALTSSVSLTVGSWVWIAFLWNGTTSPKFIGRSGSTNYYEPNLGVTGSASRVAYYNAGGQTSLPATLTLASITQIRVLIASGLN